ncbi:MAG: hybrid sensor histidine kinase/response regulator [Chloroflexi bacterium]|jgi:signal transduction histidine kinase|nr:hybrid sensor histidine kinase/response regulator [Chloroflexota bacterium]
MTQNIILAEKILDLEDQVQRLEQENTGLKTLLEKALAGTARGNFLDLISHELRTPLTSVNGALELLNEGEVGPLNNCQVEFLRVAVKNTHRMIHLIEILFDIARFETGLLKLEPVRVNLKSILENLLAAGLRQEFDRKQINLTLEIKPSQLVEADPQRLHQIFENLLSNALKFTPCDGAVAVTAVPQFDGRVLISVRDSGPGLSEQSQAYLLGKSFQLEHFLVRDINNSGLGLTITNCLLTLHQSSLQVESLPGRGATFSFALRTPC